MEKTIYIDKKPVRLKATAGFSKKYKAQFHRDYFADLMKMGKVFSGGNDKKMSLENVSYEDLEHLDFEVLYDIVWTMAKSADKSIPAPEEWLDGFETFPLKDIMPDIQELIAANMQNTKKK